jgi:hypothetical protein
VIDIENEIYNAVSKQLKATYKNIFITGEYVKAPPSFPCVSIVEMDNQAYRKTRSTDCVENHAQVMYRINIYSNKVSGKKAECKSILAIVDNVFGELGFNRMGASPIQNENDATVYRIIAQYRAVVSKEKNIYRG